MFADTVLGPGDVTEGVGTAEGLEGSAVGQDTRLEMYNITWNWTTNEMASIFITNLHLQ